MRQPCRSAPTRGAAGCRRGAAPLLLTLLLAACGGEPQDDGDTVAAAGEGAGAPTAPASAPADACEMLSADDVQAILGEPVSDTLALSMVGPEGATTLSQCNYMSPAVPGAASLMLRLGSEGQTALEASEGVREVMNQPGFPVDDVPGLGDVAFWGSDQLHVFRDDGWYLIIMPFPEGGLAQARSIAERALERLDGGA